MNNYDDDFRLVLIDHRIIHGQRVGWYNKGHVYMSRNMHDSLPDDMQGRLHTCNTPREFDALCRQFAALSALKPQESIA